MVFCLVKPTCVIPFFFLYFDLVCSRCVLSCTQHAYLLTSFFFLSFCMLFFFVHDLATNKTYGRGKRWEMGPGGVDIG